MNQLNDIVETIRTYHPDADVAVIRQAYELAEKAHDGQTRRSGEPYVTHPLSVAGIVAQLKLDVPTVCAGLLHDAVEDTAVTVQQLTDEFGNEVAFLVDGVTKLGKLPYSTREEQQAENFRKMLLAMARDIRVILLKFCDRLDNMRTLQHLPQEKQERIATETLQIYAPLAHRLGIQWVKNELEDLSFKYLHADEFYALKQDMAQTKSERQEYIHDVEKLIADEMLAAGIKCQTSGRAKHMWSIRQKMKRSNRAYEDIHDAIGFRVITDSIKDCYGALGVAHSKWTPIPGRFKDFIALPKPNMYQSLHTSVIGPNGERVEVQIRTEEMHLVAEQGIAAHWKYKDGNRVSTAGDEKFTWLREMMEAQKDLKDPNQFLESVKIDLFSDEVYVFTPEGDVKALRKGSCPIDFAYSIHTKVGDHCSGARVNGVIVPLRYELRNGDTVEIITSPNQKPNKDWLKLVKTSRARTKIRHRLHKEQRDRAIDLGREMLERALRKAGASLNRLTKQGTLEKTASELKCHGVDDLICQVGYGNITPAQVVTLAVPQHKRKPGAKNEASNPLKAILRKVVSPRRDAGAIRVQGESDVLVRFGRCCSPLPGDEIVGFITRGRGVTVHRRDCVTALDIEPERRIDVQWDDDTSSEHDVTIRVRCTDKPGLLAHISKVFSEAGVNISQAHCRSTEDGRALNTFHARVRHLDQLKGVMRQLSKIKGVFAVERGPAE